MCPHGRAESKAVKGLNRQEVVMKKSVGARPFVYPTPVFVVGTYDKDGRPNVMTAAWGGICCSKPPCVTISLRKATYTYGNIMENRCFTISIPSQEYLKEVDYFGIASGKKEELKKKLFKHYKIR